MSSTPITRAFDATVDAVASNERTVTAIVNTNAVDRFRSVIEPSGIDLEAFRKLPVLLWEHGKCPTRGRLPIGRALWIKKQGNGLVMRAQFGKDDYSQALWEMYRDGVCRGWSIHALPDPKQTSPPTRAEIRNRPEMAECDIVFRACELAEVSAVAVPGNADTLTTLVERGIWYPQDRADAGPGPQPARPSAPLPPTTASAGDDDDDEGEGDDDESIAAGCDGKPAKKKKGRAKETPMAAEPARSLPPLEGVTFREIYTQTMLLMRRNHAEQMRHIQEMTDLLRGRV